MSSKRAKRKKRKENFATPQVQTQVPVPKESSANTKYEKKPERLPGQRILKIASVLLIIAGALAGIIAYYSFQTINEMDADAFTSLTAAYGQTPGDYMFSLIFACIAGIFQIIFGYEGFRGAEHLSKAHRLFIYGWIMLAVELGVQIFGLMTSDITNWASLLSALVIPVVYIWGAYQNEKYARSHPGMTNSDRERLAAS